MMLEFSSITAWAQSFPPVPVPRIPDVPTAREIRSAVRDELRAAGTYRSWKRGHKALLLDEATKRHAQIVAAHLQLTEDSDVAYRRFLDLDPATNLLVLQAVFADNGATAGPVDLAGSDLLVFMWLPTPDNLVWPETSDRTSAGNLTAKKRTKAEIHDEYLRLLIRHVTATAREALATQPRLSSIRVVVLQEGDQTSLKSTPAIADVVLDASMIHSLPIPSGWEKSWDALLRTWITANGVPIPPFDQAWARFTSEAARNLLQSDDAIFSCVRPHLKVRQLATGALKPVASLGQLFPNVDFESLDDSKPIAGIDPIAENPAALHFPEFWAESRAVADEWTSGLGQP